MASINKILGNVSYSTSAKTNKLEPN